MNLDPFNGFDREINQLSNAEFYPLHYNHVDLGFDLVGHQIAAHASAADIIGRLSLLSGINHSSDLLYRHE